MFLINSLKIPSNILIDNIGNFYRKSHSGAGGRAGRPITCKLAVWIPACVCRLLQALHPLPNVKVLCVLLDGGGQKRRSWHPRFFQTTLGGCLLSVSEEWKNNDFNVGLWETCVVSKAHYYNIWNNVNNN